MNISMTERRYTFFPRNSHGVDIGQSHNCSGKGLRPPIGALLRKKGRLRDGLRVQQTTRARYCVTLKYERGTARRCGPAGPLLIASIQGAALGVVLTGLSLVSVAALAVRQCPLKRLC